MDELHVLTAWLGYLLPAVVGHRLFMWVLGFTSWGFSRSRRGH